MVLSKIFTKAHDMLALLCFACVAAYLSLCFVWMIFGAILNPNKFLPYAASAIVLLLFVISQRSELTANFGIIKDIALASVRKRLRKIATKSAANLTSQAGSSAAGEAKR